MQVFVDPSGKKAIAVRHIAQIKMESLELLIFSGGDQVPMSFEGYKDDDDLRRAFNKLIDMMEKAK